MEPLFFLDTDIGPDCDDMAALAILLSLCEEGKGRLLGVTHCTGSPYGLAAIDCVQKRFGLQLPLGTCKDASFLSAAQYLSYTPHLYHQFPHDYPLKKAQPEAAEVFAAALENVSEKSVTLITIGPLNNLSLFLSHPIAGKRMREKVKHIVAMGGAFETEAPYIEWNIQMDIPSARNTLSLWEGEMDFCPSEAFSPVLTGECLNNFPDHPVSAAYRIFTKGKMLRPSWDLGTVAAALLGAQAPYVWSEKGRITIDEKGYTHFAPDPAGKHRYLRLTGDPHQAEMQLEALLKSALEKSR